MDLTDQAKKMIAARFREVYPKAKMHEGRNDYVADPLENLKDIRWVGKPKIDLILKSLAEGDGNELKTSGKRPAKFNAAYSSAALVVNTFGPWMPDPDKLLMDGVSRFRSVEFEKKLEVVPKGGAANLDLVASGFEGVVAVESKFLELLSKPLRDIPFKGGYHFFRNKPNCEIWYEQVIKINNHPDKYRYLDAKQLTSHALGLLGSYGPYPVKLMYLFWEPENAREIDVYRAHRDEIEAFKMEVLGSTVQLESMSYPELWETWNDKIEPAWLKGHVEKLKARYVLNI